MTSSSEGGTTSEVRLPDPRDGEGRMVLNFYYEGGVHVTELPDGARLTVGRAEHADVTLSVSSLSREHARFVRRGEEVWVEDLGSRNGVLRGAEGIERARLAPGSAVRLGTVTAVVYSLAHDQPATRGAGVPSVGAGEAAGSLEPASEASARPLLPVVRSPRMRALQTMIQRVAATDMPVLILGETGVGKELVAEAIHRESARRRGAFRAINCGAIPDNLLSSLLFGHEKGAFTGASQVSKGLFEQAQGGSVFLDEVGELSAQTQAALLRVLETKRVTRLGSHTELQLDTRIIAATHRDLDCMTRDGAFRRDLLFRLNAFVLTVPPLRERRDEIGPLTEYFLARAESRLATGPRRVEETTLAALRAYTWPGNVRELRNVLEHALVMSEGDSLRVPDLPDHVRNAGQRAPMGDSLTPGLARDMSRLHLLEHEGYRDRVREYEVALILDGLRLSNGNQTQAAELLKLPLRTLVHKMKAYGIRRGHDAE
ncbi:MAG TPA: sigma 54-interacting transcriptional regulator [Polyangiales bacterium]